MQYTRFVMKLLSKQFPHQEKDNFSSKQSSSIQNPQQGGSKSLLIQQAEVQKRQLATLQLNLAARGSTTSSKQPTPTVILLNKLIFDLKTLKTPKNPIQSHNFLHTRRTKQNGVINKLKMGNIQFTSPNLKLTNC